MTANGTTTLLVLTQIQPITVIFTLAEDNLDQVLTQLRRGAKLPVEAWDRQMSKQIATGQLESVDNQIDTSTGTVKLRATFPNRDNALFPNQFVNTRLPVQTFQNQVLIPSSAIQRNGSAAFVYVIQNNRAMMTTVTPGVTNQGTHRRARHSGRRGGGRQQLRKTSKRNPGHHFHRPATH